MQFFYNACHLFYLKCNLFLTLHFSEFINNTASLDSEGALMAFRYPISFLGTILFRGNRGGGTALLQSYLNNYGSVWFEKNYAMEGGGIEMRDSSFVRH